MLKSFHIKIIHQRDAFYLDDTIEPETYKQLCLSIQFTDISIKIDVLIQHGELPLQQPCKKLDFDVNGLFMNLENGIYISKHLKVDMIEDVLKLYDIFKNIDRKHANMLIDCSETRYNKMKSRGWTIGFKTKLFIYYLQENYDGNCIICQETIPIEECRVKYTKCKCDLRICLECITQNISKLAICPLCNTLTYEQHDEPLKELNLLQLLNKDS